jgi:hypothetical protein
MQCWLRSYHDATLVQSVHIKEESYIARQYFHPRPCMTSKPMLPHTITINHVEERSHSDQVPDDTTDKESMFGATELAPDITSSSIDTESTIAFQWSSLSNICFDLC